MATASCTFMIWSSNSPDAQTYPTRQPVMAYFFEKLNAATMRSFNSGTDARLK